MKATGQHPLEFSATQDAVEWLQRHGEGILVGTLVVAAGITFVVVSAGAGLLILAPLAVL